MRTKKKTAPYRWSPPVRCAPPAAAACVVSALTNSSLRSVKWKSLFPAEWTLIKKKKKKHKGRQQSNRKNKATATFYVLFFRWIQRSHDVILCLRSSTPASSSRILFKFFFFKITVKASALNEICPWVFLPGGWSRGAAVVPVGSSCSPLLCWSQTSQPRTPAATWQHRSINILQLKAHSDK